MGADPALRDAVYQRRLTAIANEYYWKNEAARYETISKATSYGSLNSFT